MNNIQNDLFNKTRYCWSCKRELYFPEFKEINKIYTNDQLKRMWFDDLYRFLCCECNKRFKKNQEFEKIYLDFEEFKSKAEERVCIKCGRITKITEHAQLNHLKELQELIEKWQDTNLVSFCKECVKAIVVLDILLTISYQLSWAYIGIDLQRNYNIDQVIEVIFSKKILTLAISSLKGLHLNDDDIYNISKKFKRFLQDSSIKDFLPNLLSISVHGNLSLISIVRNISNKLTVENIRPFLKYIMKNEKLIEFIQDLTVERLA